jgi:hypothetical protein
MLTVDFPSDRLLTAQQREAKEKKEKDEKEEKEKKEKEDKEEKDKKEVSIETTAYQPHSHTIVFRRKIKRYDHKFDQRNKLRLLIFTPEEG